MENKKFNSLQDIFQDEFFLENFAPKLKSAPISYDNRVIAEFEEINNFYEKFKRKPEKNNNISERKLAVRLEGILQNIEKISYLKPYDRNNLLEKNFENFSEILDDFKNFSKNSSENSENGDFENDDIFEISHFEVIKKERNSADFVARREKCPDFEKYENLFENCHEKLKSGKWIVTDEYSRYQFEVGTFGIIEGMLFFIAKISDEEKRSKWNKKSRRTLVVFENGTQANFLDMSVMKMMSGNGAGRKGGIIVSTSTKVDFSEKPSGYIYILESLSQDLKVSNIKNLYKIGFSTTSVEERIKNAKTDTTYLMADVKIIATYEISGANIQKFEHFIHRFFADVQLDIDIADENGKFHKAREWYLVPLEIIEKAIFLFKNGEIVNYFYDKNSEQILYKK